MCGKESFQPFSFLSLFLCPPRTQFSKPASEGLASARSNPPEETVERSQCFSSSSELCLFPPLSEYYYKSCSHTQAHRYPHISPSSVRFCISYDLAEINDAYSMCAPVRECVCLEFWQFSQRSLTKRSSGKCGFNAPSLVSSCFLSLSVSQLHRLCSSMLRSLFLFNFLHIFF